MTNNTGGTGRPRRIVIVGIPGVGKTTVVSKVVEILHSKGKQPKMVNYGSVMLEEATRIHNLKSRDEIRKLSIETQRALQVHAATSISKMDEEIVIVDTHLFIATKEGFWPGIPMDVLQALKPTNLICVTATPKEILYRRKNDSTRMRDEATEESLQRELDAANSLLFASTVITGCPALVAINEESHVEQTAETIVRAIESS
jgi:adenylate kinase